MTLQEPDTQLFADAEIPDTEVIVVAHPSPVFVDSTGRRRRLLRRVAYGFGALCMAYGGLISVSLAGGPVSPSAVLPLPDLADGDDKAVAAVRPSPTPDPFTAVPSTRPVMEIFPQRNLPATRHTVESGVVPRSVAPAARPTRTPTARRTTKPATSPTAAKPVESGTTKPTTPGPTVPPTGTPTAPADPVPPAPPIPPGTGGSGGTGGGTGTGTGSDDGDSDDEVSAPTGSGGTAGGAGTTSGSGTTSAGAGGSAVGSGSGGSAGGSDDRSSDPPPPPAIANRDPADTDEPAAAPAERPVAQPAGEPAQDAEEAGGAGTAPAGEAPR
ncbi:hypothetical protein [Couchioplanes azureus]|uniref:hypothetical protein n=1 Tax=Couchioplanes caeruleus TaxID=56438 RepID=UPI0016717EDF|nr:hypothetical protein [Couchioplanes caeruleus]GGQ41642.1 hypothetical protein GCM10010166_06540 [Couchioplanes caeruleus subsp. azureus]